MRTIAAAFLFFIALHTHAQTNEGGSINGTVLDHDTGKPIPGARIQFPDLHRSTTTKSDGTFIVQGLPTSELLIQVSMLGYATVTDLVNPGSQHPLTFKLKEIVTEMADVVVTGTTKATLIKRDPAPILLLEPRFLRSEPASNILETVGKAPGMSTLTTGPNVSKPYIRGLGYNRVLTLFNGVRLEGQQWGDEHGVEVDQFLVGRVEVVKGPASLMYGSDALAGVINLLPEPAAPDSTLTGSALMGYASNNRAIISSVSINSTRKGFIRGGRLSHKQASNYGNTFDGLVAGTKYNETDAYAYAGVNRAWGYSHLSIALFDLLQEIPDGGRDSSTRAFTRQVSENEHDRIIIPNKELRSYRIAVLHQRVQHQRLAWATSARVGAGRITTNFGVQRSARREYDHPEYADIPGLYLQLITATYDVKWHAPTWHQWEVTPGINGFAQWNNADRGTEFVIPSHRTVDIGSFVHVKRRLGLFDLAGGLRGDTRYFNGRSLY
ncbi:MAG TPA: TonB-dependent receptor plug domain-containing protein, partial [Flavobacteriales bacterium]|nr:TonB-dependent receptor plug domain-containing protein [Flavobacteriales bacterium]